MNKFIYKPNLSLREIRDIQSGDREERAAYIDGLEKMHKESIEEARDKFERERAEMMGELAAAREKMISRWRFLA